MKTIIDCNYIEEVIFKSSIDELGENEKSQIVKHINSCEKCLTSEKLVDYIKLSIQIELDENKLLPNPAVLESLKSKLIATNKKQNPISNIIKGFFELRVPVYQVVTVLLIIGAFLFFLDNKQQNFDSFGNHVSINAAIDSNKISMSLQNSLELMDSYKKGKSIVEDSVLSNFIQSAM